ncbi:MAG: hypothetical protein WDA75_18700 [Candidatus Latescibacterota bacterium]|jgi:hypothetical protein
MEFFGDMAFVIGAIGMIIYLCLITIRFTSQASRVKVAIHTYDESIERLKCALAELHEKRAALDPDVDVLVTRMISLRETRDRLSLQYGEMVARSREREINIGYRAR